MTNAPEEDYDDCPVCERQTRYDGDRCTECGRLWGIDYSREDIAARLLHETAEGIANSTPLPATWRAGVDITPELLPYLVEYGTACALAGMEAAR